MSAAGWFDLGRLVGELYVGELLYEKVDGEQLLARLRTFPARIENRLRELGVPVRLDGLSGELIHQEVRRYFQAHPDPVDLWFHLGFFFEVLFNAQGFGEIRGLPRAWTKNLLLANVKNIAAIASGMPPAVLPIVTEYIALLDRRLKPERFLSEAERIAKLLREQAHRGVEQRVDVGIITMKEEEFAAVLAVLPATIVVRKQRHYNVCSLETSDGRRCRIGVVRTVDQGTGEAQDVAHDFIGDLRPAWLLAVGIAGGAPRDEFSLGDVVVSTNVLDLTVEARSPGKQDFAVRGGRMADKAATLAANLVAMRSALGTWFAPEGVGIRPPVSFAADRFFGPQEWQQKVQESIEFHHATARPPKATAGVIASSDRLLKDPELLALWLQVGRDIAAIEMESAGIYRAAREAVTFLAIRGISDVVGYKRSAAWTEYACRTAACFTAALLRTGELLR